MTPNCLARVSLVFRTYLAPVSHILERDTCETPARHVRDMCETPTSDLHLNYTWFTLHPWMFLSLSFQCLSMVNYCFWLFFGRKISKCHELPVCGNYCHKHKACLPFCRVLHL